MYNYTSVVIPGKKAPEKERERGERGESVQ